MCRKILLRVKPVTAETKMSTRWSLQNGRSNPQSQSNKYKWPEQNIHGGVLKRWQNHKSESHRNPTRPANHVRKPKGKNKKKSDRKLENIKNNQNPSNRTDNCKLYQEEKLIMFPPPMHFQYSCSLSCPSATPHIVHPHINNKALGNHLSRISRGHRKAESKPAGLADLLIFLNT